MEVKSSQVACFKYRFRKTLDISFNIEITILSFYPLLIWYARQGWKKM